MFVTTLTQLPDDAKLLIMPGLSAALTFFLMWLSTITKIDLKGYADAVAAVLGPIIITVVESWLNLIPPAYDNIVATAIHLLVLLVGSMGTLFLVRRPVPLASFRPTGRR